MTSKLKLSSFAAAAVIAASVSAQAADLPAAPAYIKANPVAAYDWTGIYFGGHVGGGWQSSAFTDPGAGQTLANCCEYSYLADGSGVVSSNSNSFLGGAQIGANYQIGRLVVGSEFDISKTNLNNNGSYLFPYYYPGTDSAYYNATESFGVRTDWTATATATIGVARDRWLLYSKAGVAWAHNNYSFNLGANYDTLLPYYNVTGSSSDIVTGWTVGVGLKWAFWNNLIGKIEYDYMDFGSHSVQFTGPWYPGYAPLTFSPTFTQNISELKFGLEYKFDPGYIFW